jgi:hypothetical protein
VSRTKVQPTRDSRPECRGGAAGDLPSRGRAHEMWLPRQCLCRVRSFSDPADELYLPAWAREKRKRTRRWRCQAQVEQLGGSRLTEVFPRETLAGFDLPGAQMIQPFLGFRQNRIYASARRYMDGLLFTWLVILFSTPAPGGQRWSHRAIAPRQKPDALPPGEVDIEVHPTKCPSKPEGWAPADASRVSGGRFSKASSSS